MVRVWLGVIAVGVLIILFASSAVLPGTALDVPGARGADVVPENEPPRTGIWPVNWTFYGSAGGGWGLTSASLSNPGPTVTVYRGDLANLTLISTDSTSVKHTWFIDYNGNNIADGNEPSSPDFTSAQTIIWNFTADQSGNWTYKCGYHQTSMTGTIIVLSEPRPVTLTFYGGAAEGWGFSTAKVTNPGPSLVVLWGTKVNLTLISTDSTSVKHTWFIDYNGNNIADGNEPSSPDFTSAQTIIWNFTADQSGNWTYKCGYHQTSMTGTILIVGGPPLRPPSRIAIPLITGIMIGTLGVVLAFAAVYHVRAVRAAKRMKSGVRDDG